MQGQFNEKKLLYNIIAKHNPEAYGELYDLYVSKIYRFVFLKLSNREEAEDITSEVFLQAWHYLTNEKEKKVKSFSGLIYKIARNKLIDLYRSKSRKPELSLDQMSEAELPIMENVQKINDSLEKEKILSAIKKLKQGYQEIILFKYIEELSVSEIAEILGKNKTNVRVTLYRALKILKRLMDDKEIRN